MRNNRCDENWWGACPTRYSVTEDKDSLNPYVQERLFKNLGSYFDNLNKIKNNPVEMEKLKNDLTLAVETINVERAGLIESCKKEKEIDEPQPVYQAVSDYLATELLTLDTDTDCSKSKRELIKALMEPTAKIEGDRVVAKPNEATLAKFKKIIDDDPELVRKINAIMYDRANISAEDLNSANATMGAGIRRALAELIPSDSLSTVCLQPESVPTAADISESGNLFISGISAQKASPCQYIIGQAIESDEQNQCLAPAQMGTILSAIAPLFEVGNALNDSTLEALLSTANRNGNQLKNILMPGCQDRKNLIPMNNVSCASFSMCDESKYIDMDNNTYNGPAGGCYGMERARSEMRLRVFNGITQDHAIGLTVCTTFMKDTSRKTDFCKKAGSGVPNHDNHAMAISGYRCNEGKLEYQVLNSWGGHCPDSGKVANSGVNCERDESDNPTGKFWVKEDILVDSTVGLTQITRQTPPLRSGR